jgi:cell division protease FtsH
MSSLTRPYIEKYLVVPLAGRASEEPVFGGGTAGAGGLPNSDLARATRLATELEKSFGLGFYGLVCVGDEPAHDLLLFEHLRTAVQRDVFRSRRGAASVSQSARSTQRRCRRT